MKTDSNHSRGQSNRSITPTNNLKKSVVGTSSFSGHVKPLANTTGIKNNYKHNTSQFFTVSNNQDSAEAEMILNMNKNTYHINLGSKKTTFMLNDPIFALEEQMKSIYIKDTKCISCEKELEKKNKNFW